MVHLYMVRLRLPPHQFQTTLEGVSNFPMKVFIYAQSHSEMDHIYRWFPGIYWDKQLKAAQLPRYLLRNLKRNRLKLINVRNNLFTMCRDSRMKVQITFSVCNLEFYGWWFSCSWEDMMSIPGDRSWSLCLSDCQKYIAAQVKIYISNVSLLLDESSILYLYLRMCCSLY